MYQPQNNKDHKNRCRFALYLMREGFSPEGAARRAGLPLDLVRKIDERWVGEKP